MVSASVPTALSLESFFFSIPIPFPTCVAKSGLMRVRDVGYLILSHFLSFRSLFFLTKFSTIVEAYTGNCGFKNGPICCQILRADQYLFCEVEAEGSNDPGSH